MKSVPNRGTPPSSGLSVVSLAVIAFASLCGAVRADGNTQVRPAYMAGSWYPGDAGTLAKRIDELLAKADAPTVTEKPLAVIAPHAGYDYSAPTAAAGYRCLKGQVYRRVFVMAFSHKFAGSYQGVDVPGDLTAYETPLGQVPIDREACDQLLKHEPFVSKPEVGAGEHSLELQLPFLQRVLAADGQLTGEFRLVPLLVGRMSTEDYAKAAEAIFPLIDGDTLLVASSDFTHFGPRFGYEPFKDGLPEKLRGLADAAAAPLLKCDFDGFEDHLAKTQDTICGRGPIMLLLRVLSRRAGATGLRAAFDTSGRITGDWANSVSYQSLVFTPRPGTLDKETRAKTLELARRTVEATLKGEKSPPIDTGELPPALRAEGACFVTLENHGRLRGCIGNMAADGPLYESVARNAAAACRDQRFFDNPVTAAELSDLDIEVSYLTPMKRIEKIEDIVVGQHGLWMTRAFRRGVLLPQVAYERGWTREQFLAETCRKAGLPLEAWKEKETEIYSFEAEVFGEKEK